MHYFFKFTAHRGFYFLYYLFTIYFSTSTFVIFSLTCQFLKIYVKHIEPAIVTWVAYFPKFSFALRAHL